LVEFIVISVVGDALLPYCNSVTDSIENFPENGNSQ